MRELSKESSIIQSINWGKVEIKYETLKEFRTELEQMPNEDFHRNIGKHLVCVYFNPHA